MKQILKNITSLFIIQGSQYITPLIIFPYLARIYDLETLGLWLFALSTVGLFRILVAFGFDLVGTRDIARISEVGLTSKLFFTITLLKIALSTVSVIAIVILTFTVEAFSDASLLLLISSIVLFADALFPIWYFIGIQKVETITLIRVFQKILYAALILVAISKDTHIIFVPLIEGVIAIICSIFAFLYAKNRFKLKYNLLKFDEVKKLIQESSLVFFSNASVSIYTGLNTVILGILISSEAVAIFSIAEKVYLAFVSLLNPLVRAFYPVLANMRKTSKFSYRRYIRILLMIYSITAFVMCFLVNYFSVNLINLVAGEIIQDSVNALTILSFAIMINFGTYFSSLLILEDSASGLLKITNATAVFNILLLYPMCTLFGVVGLAYLTLIVQAFHSFCHLANRLVQKRRVFE